MESAIPDPDGTNLPDIVALPRMKRLILRAPAIPLSYLMDRLCLPKRTTLELDMTIRTEPSIPVFQHALARHYMSTSPPGEAPEDPFRCLVIVQSAMLMCMLASPDGMPSYITPPLEYQALRTAYPLSIFVESNFIPIFPWFYQHFTDAFSQSTQLAIDTLVLRIQGKDLLEAADCTWLSYPQISLKRIVLIGPVFEKFVVTFARHDATANGAEPRAQPDRVRLPFLERLKVHSFDFLLLSGRAALTQLIAGLKRRAHAVPVCDDGIPKICLELCCCDIEDAQVEDLRAVSAVRLEWDGKTNGLEVSCATKT
ncbi:hypothetical protein EWM64_g1512 [Hericium alpestre]|uniref:Uncharacterized protein n=1 Tax=Hericium alpestre TaxID=135208 RepID=A0A4Z0A9A2_9AGAM|nr:hypothetical protein EWM64_g1512 [Hericium alpestre]